MITPITNITFKKQAKQLKLNDNAILNPPLDNYKQNSIYLGDTKINFGGYLSIKPKVSLEYGIENNFFKLPKVKNEDGTTTQIQPDKHQIECAKYLCEGKNVLFDAPTGIGKTSVAHFAINKNLAEGKRTIYTVPIKALANDKYNQFVEIYGEKNVGILTGDRKINGNAPIVIQTTEIFNNQSQTMHLNDAMKIGTVVYDEIHYLGDYERGMAWENSIVQAASRGIQILGLSATIGNAQQLTSWIDSISYTRDTARVAVAPEERPVPLIWSLYASVDSKSEKFYPIMLGEVDLSQDLPDTTQSIIDFIYDTEQMYFEMQHRKDWPTSGCDYEYTQDENYRKEIPLKLANALGEDWINADFGDKKVIQKLKETFPSLIGSDIEQIKTFASKTGVKSLSDRQKRGLSIIFNLKENAKDVDYKNAYEQLRKDLENIKCDTETFKKYLRYKYPNLDKTELDLLPQLLSRPDVKNVNEVQKVVEIPDYAPLIRKLEKQNKLPAIIFKLSQSGCESACESLLGSPEETEEKLDEMLEPTKTKKNSKNRTLDLLTQEEKEEVRKILDRYKKDGVYLGANVNTETLLRGWGVHHAGRLPQYKKLIEELFAKKLLKVVFATSTLGAGINMPAKTVVMSSISYDQYNPNTKETHTFYISPSEFHQMAGRAGRRGIDKVGYDILFGLTTDEQAAAMEKASDDETVEIEDCKGELSRAYELMKSPAEPLTSSAGPDPVSLMNFYLRHKEEQSTYLWDLIKTSFRVYCAQDKNKESEEFYQELLNYTKALLKMNYLIPNYMDFKGFMATPKGKILSMSQGINPLLMSSLLCNERLADVTPTQLAQIVGSIQGASKYPEKHDFQSLILEKLKIAQMNNSKAGICVEDFYKIDSEMYWLARGIGNSLMESGRYFDDKHTDSFAGMVTYLFASLNQHNSKNTVKNFEKISRDLNVDIPEFKKINNEYANRTSEGNIYKIIAGSISTLKQIVKICDFALSNEEDFPNVIYWENLKETAKQAIELLDKEPINNDPNYAS